MHYFLRLLYCFILCVGTPSLYASAIAVSPLSVDLSPEARYQDIQVRNVGTDTAYVRVDVARIQNPGQANQTLIQLNDNPYQIGLIVTPSKVVIPVGQTRIVRVLYVGQPPVSDVVYRVKISPVTGELVALYAGKQQLSAGVQLVIAYGVSVYARPLKLQPQAVAKRVGTSLTLSNTGNTSVLITLCKQCTASGSCQSLPDLVKRLFPGNVAQLSLQKAGPLQCQEEILHNQFVPFNIQ